MFVERKIIERLHGRKEQHLSAIVGLKALTESVQYYEEIGRPEFTALCPNLDGMDPDDAFSSVPYGCNFLFYLEEILGGPSVFEPWLLEYVKTFSHKSIQTQTFKDHLYGYIRVNHIEKLDILDSVDWDKWVNGFGM
ncbi:Leukotriene A-4 hydrolase, partial [Nowakowskiella sp. JEL0078]